MNIPVLNVLRYEQGLPEQVHELSAGHASAVGVTSAGHRLHVRGVRTDDADDRSVDCVSKSFAPGGLVLRGS